MNDSETINRLIGEKADLEVKLLRAQELLQEVLDDPLLASWNQNFIDRIDQELKSHG